MNDTRAHTPLAPSEKRFGDGVHRPDQQQGRGQHCRHRHLPFVSEPFGFPLGLVRERHCLNQRIELDHLETSGGSLSLTDIKAANGGKGIKLPKRLEHLGLEGGDVSSGPGGTFKLACKAN